MLKRKCLLAIAALLPPSSSTPTASTQPTRAPTLSPVPTNVRVQDANEYEFPQLIPFDGIPPVYDPKFASAADAPLLDDESLQPAPSLSSYDWAWVDFYPDSEFYTP